MLAIRFQRVGRRHQPAFRVVVAEKSSKRDSPPVEDLGYYDPLTKKGAVNKERLGHWIKVGAKPTVSVHNFLVRIGALEGRRIPIGIRLKKESEKNQPEIKLEATEVQRTQAES